MRQKELYMSSPIIKISDIDPTFDFTSDTPHFWDNYWSGDSILGHAFADPDSESKTMQLYHQLLYSRVLPNGERMDLTAGGKAEYLSWRDMCFSSDSIIVSFRYKKYRNMLVQFIDSVEEWQTFIEKYVKASYTLGGEIIFPKRRGGINQSRGCNPKICDRWDLTLECIRKYYSNEESPLTSVLTEDKAFFDLFVDFKGYVDYFFLQDCVTDDCKSVDFWLESDNFKDYPFPKSKEEYYLWIKRELEFVKKRNTRIEKFCKTT